MMTSLWRWFISILVWLSADPAIMTEERPRCAAAVAVAYAALAEEPEPAPAPPKPVGPVNTPPKQPCPTGTCPLR